MTSMVPGVLTPMALSDFGRDAIWVVILDRKSVV